VSIELEHSRSTVGKTEDDPLAQKMGTDVCFWCKCRLSPDEIAACEAPDGIGRCPR
jgi:hypothetical protein